MIKLLFFLLLSKNSPILAIYINRVKKLFHFLFKLKILELK